VFAYPWGVSEDDLTGDFFGLMRHLPDEAVLIPFLDLIQRQYPDRDIRPQHFEQAEVLLWPDYEIPKEWRTQFNRPDIPAERRRSKHYIVPDAVLIVGHYTFIVEAEKSHSIEAEQLFQQYMIGQRMFVTPTQGRRKVYTVLINTDQMRPSACRITATDESTGIAVSAGDSVPRYIEKRARMLGEACDVDEVSRRFLWVSWHHIGKLAEEVIEVYGHRQDRVSMIISRFLSGFKEMTDREGYYPVRVYRADDPDEVVVEDYDLVPATGLFPAWEDCLPDVDPGDIPLLRVREKSLQWDPDAFEGSRMNPTDIPAAKLMPDMTDDLARRSIRPDAIRILSEQRG